jgi:hypothetical protein
VCINIEIPRMSDNYTADNCANVKDGYNINEVYGKIVVIKRTGQDSASFELMDDSYTFGRYKKQ